MADPERRSAAVLILVYPRAGNPHVVFTARSPMLSNHAGQISLPGGSSEPSDPSLEFTALRETQEEIGVPATAVRVLGPLAELDTGGSFFRITPFVGIVTAEPTFEPEPAEVARIIEVPLSVLCDPDTLGEAEWEVRSGMRRSRFYGYEGDRIWGVTASIVAQFLDSPYPALAEALLRQEARRT